jgi:hypothetical protein
MIDYTEEYTKLFRKAALQFISQKKENPKLTDNRLITWSDLSDSPVTVGITTNAEFTLVAVPLNKLSAVYKAIDGDI